MMDTRLVRRAAWIAEIALGLILGGICPAQSPVPSPVLWADAVAHAAKTAPQARIVVLDIAGGHVLAASHLADAARTLAAPGSTLKPLALYGLVSARRWDPGRRIACDRKLYIAGRSLVCSHPATGPMDATEALAWSCNTYFAAVGAGLGRGELRRMLAQTGLLSQTGLAPGEAVAAFHEPQSRDEASLALLGVDGVRVTPLELAAAYRWLALELERQPDSVAAQTVQAGLSDSASFGIAASASLGGVPVAGKTGTANSGPGTPSHGWFVGLVPAQHPSAVVVVYLPAGHGADAARAAADLLVHSPLKKSAP